MEYRYQDGRIYSEIDGKVMAEILFPMENGVANIKETFVDDSLRGQGIAAVLVEQAVDTIRANRWKAKATCSYAKAWFEKHPEQKDLLTEE